MRIQVATWRDIADDASGGSEVHLDRITTEWARLGHDVSVRSVAVSEEKGAETVSGQFGDGRVRRVRRGGRFTGVVRTTAALATRRDGHFDLAIDVWNGVPFMSPLWARRRLVLLHHLHNDLWPATFGPFIGPAGRFAERVVFPQLYRRTQIATLAAAGRDELLERTVLSADRVHVVEPGIDDRFSPVKTATDIATNRPTLVAACRFAPLKRVPWLIERVAEIRDKVPDVLLVMIGDGEDRQNVEAAISKRGLTNNVVLRQEVSDLELASLFRTADLLVSGSVNEGWGMTITEAAACGTPAVVSRCSGHLSAVGPGAGVVALDDEFSAAVVGLLTNNDARGLASVAALTWTKGRSWRHAAERLLDLADRR